MNLFTKILLFTIVTLVSQHLIRIGLLILGYGNTYITHYPGKCQNVEGFTTKGSEDMILLPSGKLIITSGLVGFAGKFDYTKKLAQGQLYVMDTNKDTNSVTKLTLKGYPADSHFEPHGVNYWEHKNKSVSIFVVLHMPERVARFLYDGETTLTLTKVYENSTYMRNVNSVTATGEDSFYFSNIFYARFGDKLMFDLEFILHIPQANVVHVSGDEYISAADGLLAPNGMDGDGRYVYLISRAGLHIYTRHSNHTLNPFKVVPLNIGSADNIKLDADGDIWIGCVHTVAHIMAYWESPDDAIVHSTVIRVRDPTGAAQLESVFADDSTYITAISVAAYTKGKLLIGSINDKMVSCDVHYLSGK